MSNKKCFNVRYKNEQQKEALEYLTSPDVDLVVLEGVAGSGKTFVALAAGLGQVLDTKMYKEIIFTRAPVALGNDLGYLPGDEQEKLGPWCGALYDNLESLVGSDDLTLSYIQSKVKIRAMQFMRGRSLCDRYVIIDEVQNMSASELKVLLTRAGENTKIVALGDIGQVDNRRLSKEDNALAYLLGSVEYMPTEFVKVVHLPKSERSRLCTWASVAL